MRSPASVEHRCGNENGMAGWPYTLSFRSLCDYAVQGATESAPD